MARWRPHLVLRVLGSAAGLGGIGGGGGGGVWHPASASGRFQRRTGGEPVGGTEEGKLTSLHPVIRFGGCFFLPSIAHHRSADAAARRPEAGEGA